MTSAFRFDQTGRLPAFLDPAFALDLAVSVGATYVMPRPLGPRGFRRLDQHHLAQLITTSQLAWSKTGPKFRPLDDRVMASHDRLAKSHEAKAATAQKLLMGLGLQMTLFHSRGDGDDILAISGQNDLSTFFLAGKHLIRRTLNPQPAGPRLQTALRFAQRQAQPGRKLWIAAHSTGAVEGSFIYLEMIRRGLGDQLAGAFFLNPLNTSLLKQAALKAQQRGDVPPIYMISSQPAPQARWGNLGAYGLDFERWVTGVWHGRLPEVSRTLHFADPSFNPYDGHAFGTTCRVLASMT